MMSKESGDCSRGEAACWCSFEAKEPSVMCVRVVPPTQEWVNCLQSSTLSLLKLNFPKQRTSLQTDSQWCAVTGTKREISIFLSAKARHLVGKCGLMSMIFPFLLLEMVVV